MRDYTKEILASLLLETIIFMGVFAGWDIPVDWEYIILAHSALLFFWSILRGYSAEIFYWHAAIFFAITVLADFLMLAQIVIYPSMYVFYFLLFGLVRELLHLFSLKDGKI